MEKLLAKFVCNSVTKFAGNQVSVKLSAVIGNSEENKSFAQYTPVANLEMQITNPNALEYFAPGEEYLLEITKA